MPRMVASAPNRIVISNMITTYGGIEPTGLPPSTIGQSYDMYSVIQAPTAHPAMPPIRVNMRDRKSTRLNSSHGYISYAVFCLKKKKKDHSTTITVNNDV